MSRKNTTNTTIEAAANPVPTLSPQALQALIEEVTALRSAVAKAEASAAKPTMSVAGKTSKQIQNELQTIRAFKKAGFGTVQPHLNVKTFNRWLLENRRPLEGSKSVRAGGLRLFHVSQTRPLTKEELAKAKDQPAAAEARKGKASNVSELHPAS